MQRFPDNWDLKTKIEFLQRKIILNSIAYYMYDTNFLTDQYYDSICRQLVQLHKEYGDVRDTQYGYVFYDFDGSTGFDLYYRLNDHDKEYLTNMVKWQISQNGREGSSNRERSKKSKAVEKEEVTEEHEKNDLTNKTTSFLYPYQLDAVWKMRNGCILNGGVGSGKSRTSIFYYIKECGGWIDKDDYTPMTNPRDLVIITTAQKCRLGEWEEELAPFLLYPDKKTGMTSSGVKVTINSWNCIGKYVDVKDCFFIFDEDRVTGNGSWVKSFLKITKNNDWIVLSASPGDTWIDFVPVFIANGFFKNRSEFNREHVQFARYSKYPKIDRYFDETRLIRLRDRILIDMDFERHTTPHHEDIICGYDMMAYKTTIRSRWDPFKDEPIQQASGLCYVLRRIVNSDESRQVALLELVEKHPKVIIFYNFDYELEILKNLAYPEGTEIAEYNGHMHQPVPDGDKWVYLVNYIAGNAGWNCIKTDCIIFYSQTYSYKMLLQSCGRIDRLNTPYSELYYYHLRSKSAIDSAINRALKQKKNFNEKKFVKWE